MSIKVRLRLSYIAMLVIPIVLSILMLGLTAHAFVAYVERAYNVKFKQSPFKEFVDKGSPVFMDVKLISSSNLENMQDLKYVQELDKKLENMNAGIIIRKNEQIIYASSSLQKVVSENKLPIFGSFIEEQRGRSLLTNKPFIMKQYDFYFKDQSPGTIFLLIDSAKLSNIFYKWMIILIIAIILILGITNGLLTYYVSKSIVKPLENLKNGANEIKEGNLDFQINNASKDEIGELSTAFEDMRVKLKESIEKQNRYENNRKELISSISHDLKTPVTAIKGYVEGIMDGVADTPEKMDRYIKTVYAKSKDMDKLIDELFLYSKLDLKKLPFNFEEVDINSYLQDSFEELQFDLEKKNISITLNLENNKPLVVLADREKLKRVITNIVDNSIKYMNKEENKIEINLIEEKNNVLLEFKDNGEGIEESQLPYIFDTFYRVDPSRNRARGGSGLGLSIAKEIIKEHGGEIWAESQLGEGTSIFFTVKKCCNLS